MIAFRVSSILVVALLVAAGGNSAIASNAAPLLVAQASPAPGPVQLGPRRPLSPEGAATPRAPETRDPQPRAAPMSPSGGSGPVEVQALKALDADSVGILDDAEGGLGADMWAGADRAFVARVIALLPKKVGSRSTRDLMRRLLLTRAAAPAGKAEGPSLLALRINALFAMGDIPSAMSLIAGAPIGPIDELLLRTEVESRFYRQDTAGACGQVRGAAQDFRNTYWQEAMAYCLALAGKSAEAALMSDILAERSSSVHPAFFAAMDRLSGAPPPAVESLRNPTALHLSMMRTASLPLPADVIGDASPAVVNAVALSPNAALELRLVAAENAADSGVLPGNILNDIYSAVPFDAEMLASPLTRADREWGTMARALLMRAAIRQTVPAARAEVLSEALKLARAKGGYRVTAVASQPVLLAMAPTEDLAWFAGAAARALISVGEFDAARQWIVMGLKKAREEASEKTPADSLWPLAVLIGAEDAGTVSPDSLRQWWRARTEAGAPDAATDARALFALLDAMDIPVPASLWAPVLGLAPPNGAKMPGVGLRIALNRAAAADRRGEVVALSLAALGDDGPSAANFLAVDVAVRALRKVGLAVEAQRIALEAAVAAGL